MLPLFISIFEAILLGIFLALLTSRGGVWLARRYGLMDIPGKLPHKQHDQPVPLAGGLTILPALLLGFLIFQSNLEDLWKLLPSIVIVFLTGLLDDRRPVRYVVKLLGQTLAAGLMIVFGFGVTFLKWEILPVAPILLKSLNVLITLLWLVGATNAFNFVDSMDGLATGAAAVIATFLAAASMFSGQVALARLMGLLVGICLILYYLNLTPARLFLGDSGALTLGFLLASGAMIFSPKGFGFSQASSWFMPVMILGLPLFDMILVIFSRLRRGRPIHQADRGHTYHRLVAAGFEPGRAIALLHIVSVTLGCLSFLAIQFSPLPANLIFLAIILAGIAAIFYLDHPSRWPR
jgi:UDP-GlcNAc:undecaprenyl-phosphate GlcNAc-1-phosphate transferase